MGNAVSYAVATLRMPWNGPIWKDLLRNERGDVFSIVFQSTPYFVQRKGVISTCITMDLNSLFVYLRRICYICYLYRYIYIYIYIYLSLSKSL